MEGERTYRPLPVAVAVIFILILCVLFYVIYVNLPRLQEEGIFLLVGISVGAMVYLLTLLNIHFGLATLVLLIGISPEITIGSIPNLRLEDFVVPILLFAWLTRMVTGRERFQPANIKWPIYLYLLAGVISSLFGAYFGTIEITKSIFIFGKYVIYFLIFALFLNNIREEGEFRTMVIIVLLVGVISAFASTVESIPRLEEGRATRLMGPYGEGGNVFAGYLILIMGILIGFMLQIRKIGFKFLAGLAIVALLYPFLYTMSRTGYAGLLLGLLVYGILKKREVIAILLVGIVLFLLTAPESIFIRAATTISVLTERPDASYAARVAQWKVSMSDIMESPLFGKGLGFVNFGDVDNEYVRVAVDCGLLGVFALAWLLIAIIIQAFRMHKEVADEDDFYKSYVVGYSISVFSILILCWGVTCLSTIRTMEMFMVLTGLFYALVANYRRWRRPFMPPPEEPEFAYVEERPKPTSRT